MPNTNLVGQSEAGAFEGSRVKPIGRLNTVQEHVSVRMSTRTLLSEERKRG